MTTTRDIHPGSNGAVPRAPLEGDTTRVTRGVLQAAGISADELLDKLADKVADRAGGSGGGGGNRGRKIFGVPAALFAKGAIWVVSVAASAGLFAMTWYQAVNSGLKERPTKEQVSKSITALDNKTGARIESVKKEVQTVRESQIRTEEQTKSQAQTMNQILREIRITRRRR